MDIKIYNYSFHPVTEYAKKLGIIELEERVSHVLKENFDFEYPPTLQEIRRRCINIVQHAVQNNHKAVFIRNYESFQSDLITEFQKNGIRVFVPLYYKPTYTENLVGFDMINHISYLNIIEIIEVPMALLPEFIQSNIYLSDNKSSYQLFISGNLDTGIKVRFDLAEGSLSDIINWIQSFVSEIKINMIQDSLITRIGIRFKNINDFTYDLIQVLHQIEECKVELGEEFNPELLPEMIDVIKTISIIDSDEVQEYITLTEYASDASKRTGRDEIKLLEKAIVLYFSFDSMTKEVINRFNTKSFIKLGIKRLYNLDYNPAHLFKIQGIHYMRYELLISSEENYRKSIEYYRQYPNEEIDDVEIDFPINTLIMLNVFLSKYEVAKTIIEDRLKDIDPDENHRLIPIKKYLSNIYRNTEEYNLALEVNREIQLSLDKDSNGEDYYQLGTNNAIIYYLDSRFEKSLELLNEIIQVQDLSFMVKSLACYLYNLILFSTKKEININMMEKLSKYNNNIVTDSYCKLIEILYLIEKSRSKSLIKSKLQEMSHQYPNTRMHVLTLLGKIYAIEGNWIELSELIENIIPVYQQYSNIIQIKLNLIKYYLGIILGDEEILIKNLIEELALKDSIDTSIYYFGNKLENATEGILKILDMDLIKTEIRLFD